MPNSKYVFILAILFLMGISSCDLESQKLTYVIQGKLIDAKSNTSFQNTKIEVYNTYTGKGFDYLGICYTNANGEFSLQYELSYQLTGKYLRFYFPDTSFIASSKLLDLPIGESWNKNLNVSDSATVDVYLSRDLGVNDTLYLMSRFSKIIFIGPTQNKHIGKIRILNSTDGNYYDYSIGTYKITNNIKYVSYEPTGDPIVDILTLNINN